jgi:hypothetical protein
MLQKMDVMAIATHSGAQKYTVMISQKPFSDISKA